MGRRALVLRSLALIGAALLLLVAAGLAYLIAPGTPSASPYLSFDGYIYLPQHGLLNVEDYLTLSGNSLWVTGTSSGSVFRLSLDGRADLSQTQIAEWRGEPRVHGVALVPGRDLAFVTRSEINVVDAFSPTSLKRLARVPVADDPDGILYDPAHDLVYVVNGDAQAATLIDAEDDKNVGTIPLGGKPEFAAIDPVSGLIYQNLQSTNSLAAVDIGERRVVHRWPLAGCTGPTGIAIDAKLRRAFIVCGRSAMLVIFDLERDRIVASVKIGTGPDAVDFDPGLKRIYSTGLSGTVSIVQQKSADEYELLDNVSTHFAAHTLAVDHATHKLYVAYASLGVAPRVAVFSYR